MNAGGLWLEERLLVDSDIHERFVEQGDQASLVLLRFVYKRGETAEESDEDLAAMIGELGVEFGECESSEVQIDQFPDEILRSGIVLDDRSLTGAGIGRTDSVLDDEMGVVEEDGGIVDELGRLASRDCYRLPCEQLRCG